MGGNVFKDSQKNPATIRIHKKDVIPTIKWIESILNIPLQNNTLGSTGITDTSSDIDLAIDATSITNDKLIEMLCSKGIDRNDIRKSGDWVHLKTPICGDTSNGYVQTDFIIGDVPWQKFSSLGEPNGSKYKGAHRHILLASIAKAQGMKWSYKHGLISRFSNNVITKDPIEIARLLINGTYTDLLSVGAILNKIKSFPNYEELISDAKEELELK